MSSIGSWIALVAGDASLAYLMEHYSERCGLGLEVIADPPSASWLDEHAPALVWFPSLESLARWRANTGAAASGHDSAVVVCTSVPDERPARELGADYCLLLPLTFDDFRAAVTAVGVPMRPDA